MSDSPIKIEGREDSDLQIQTIYVDGEKTITLGTESATLYPKPLRKVLNALLKDFLKR